MPRQRIPSINKSFMLLVLLPLLLLFLVRKADAWAEDQNENHRLRRSLSAENSINSTIEDFVPPIFNGNNSIRGGFDIDAVPWFGILEADNSLGFSCGCSLIHGDIVLTAAHCVSDGRSSTYPTYVRIGGTTVTSGTRVRVTQGITHPSWQGSFTQEADVVILKIGSFLSNQVVTVNDDANVP